MKIGILTHHYVSNYGAFLQAYALREALAAEYPNAEVDLIDYINLKQFVINNGGWFRFYKERENLKCWLRKIRLPLVFAAARKKHFKCSRRCYSAKQVNKLNYDVIIIGSDEVWNYQDRRSTAKIKFAHGLTCKNILAYAPSVGNSEGNIPEYVYESIKKFSALSVRDEKTASFLREVTDQKPERVLDPTFLSKFPVEKPKDITKPYILFYYCDRLPAEVKQRIFDYAKNNDMAVYGAGECDKRYDKITVDLTPFEWVDMFRNAEFVFTGTFHGAVFSILNHRPFKVYLTNKSRIQKVRSLLTECGIFDREMDSGFVFDFEKMVHEIDYETVDRLLAERKVRSLAYLHRAIDCVEQVE